MLYTQANQLRFIAGEKQGHYESYFLRANHPNKKQAFWLRYTLFSPTGNPQDAIGEIWGAFFDNDEVIAIQEDIALKDCDLSQADSQLVLGENCLVFAHSGLGNVAGRVKDTIRSISWKLEYSGEKNVLPLFPEAYYQRSLPKAKVVVGMPIAFFNGEIQVNGKTIDIKNWQGSENHNWGSKHTDEYAWGQVSGFDDVPDSFLECSTARIKVGPLWLPRMSLAVLRVGAEEYRFNGLWRAVKNDGSYRYFDWSMQCENKGLTLEVKIKTNNHDVAGLNYRNPPGGSHTCLNSKVASCEVVLRKGSEVLHKLNTQHRAAFEILTDDDSHGIEVQNL